LLLEFKLLKLLFGDTGGGVSRQLLLLLLVVLSSSELGRLRSYIMKEAMPIITNGTVKSGAHYVHLAALMSS